MSRLSWILWRLRPRQWPRPVRRAVAFPLAVLLIMCMIKYASDGLLPHETLYVYFGRSLHFALTMTIIIGLATVGFVTGQVRFYVLSVLYGVAFMVTVVGGYFLFHLEEAELPEFAWWFHGMMTAPLLLVLVLLAITRPRQSR